MRSYFFVIRNGNEIVGEYSVRAFSEKEAKAELNKYSIDKIFKSDLTMVT